MDLTQVLLALGIPGVAIICWAVTHCIGEWLKARQAESELALKQDMVARGMSADEILRVLHAGNAPKSDGHVLASEHSATKEISELLAENGYSGEDVARILQACQGVPLSVLATIKPLIENGYAGDDIINALRACQPQESAPLRVLEPASWQAVTEVKK